MNSVERMFLLALLAALLWLVYLLQPILTPFLVGLIIAYLGDPLVDALERLGLNRTAGATLVFLLFLVVFVGALLVVIPMVLREMTQLIRDIPAFLAWLQASASPVLVDLFGIDPFDFSLDNLRTQLAGNWQQAGGVLGRLVAEATASGMAFLSTVMNIALTPVVAFYLMRDWDIAVQRIHEMVPRAREQQVVSIARECDDVLSAFLRGQMLVMLLLGCVYAAGLFLVGLDLALLIGLIAGLASIVPYLGFAIGIVAAVVAAIFQFQDVLHPVWVVGVFMIGQLLEGTLLTPWLVGDRIGLHPVAVIFAVLAGGQLFGFIGILLALPVAAVVMVFLRRFHDEYLQSEFYGEEGE